MTAGRCVGGQSGGTGVQAVPVEHVCQMEMEIILTIRFGGYIRGATKHKHTIANEPHTIALLQSDAAQAARRIVVAVLQPLQIRLDDAFRMAGDHAMLAHVDAMLEAELIGHLPFGALAEPHYFRGFGRGRPYSMEAAAWKNVFVIDDTYLSIVEYPASSTRKI